MCACGGGNFTTCTTCKKNKKSFCVHTKKEENEAGRRTRAEGITNELGREGDVYERKSTDIMPPAKKKNESACTLEENGCGVSHE